MSYDSWKARNPEDAHDLADPPEVWVDCDECGGEGAIEIPEIVSKWSLDPPGSHCIPCQACCGAGGTIRDSDGTMSASDYQFMEEAV